mmetsp:Transcript_18923/g.31318  ORF Transcript_18923/g.31318 Transcript_18923/m.31318 type:complete len:472 (-) Transcript_18923:79-1494(-)|eukprot:CAMPEP_0119004798 /NCGR_PEP_ID=MMETSP1176-20130426/1360_1 /TAXON_ID=265551 /ORGANISM="Synedropsis recta cf, Strain CCMP1620" /LENGTH=471 /DNA_ID=CAMNT_0006956545 /DNA_START=199 /DNA_END=1614 /DNA_ORIENTATION=+
MTTTTMSKSLILAAGAALVSLGQVDGFVQPQYARIQRPSVTSKPLNAVFMEDAEEGRSRLFTSRDDNTAVMNNRHSASDWLYNMFSLPRSSVFRDIRNPVVTIAVWSGVVSVLQKLFASSQSGFLQKLASSMCIGSTPHSFLVSSLGLLLVFRTNTAYQRFYEGRKIWENIHSISRNFSRFASLYEKDIGGHRKQRMLNLVAAFPYLLRNHIRPGCLCEEESQVDPGNGLLLREPSVKMVETRHEGDKQTIRGTTRAPSFLEAPQRECWVDKRNVPWSLTDDTSLKHLAKAQNRPLWVCDRIAREVMNIPYNPNFTSRERLALLGQIEKLTNTVGECERIHQTAVPLNYARHSLRSLTLWLITLPFALVKDLGLLTGPVMGVMAWLLFGVYQIGYSIEDPFQGSLRLSNLCDAIRRDVIGESSVRESAFAVDKVELPPVLDFPEHHQLFPTVDATASLLGQMNATWAPLGV